MNKRSEIMKTLKIIQIIGVLILLLGVFIRTGTGDYSGTAIAMLGILIFTVSRLTLWVQSKSD